MALTITFPVAAADLVVIVNPKNAVGKMPADQASQMFLGKSSQFTPVDQADGSAIRNEFYKKLADKENSQVKAIWSKLVFTGKASLPKEYSSSADVKKAVANDVNAIGYIEKGAVDDTVKVVLAVQ
jgi:ABC-type phosphate transport system substrate-binding protein